MCVVLSAVLSFTAEHPVHAQKLAPPTRQAAAAAHAGKLVMKADEVTGGRSPAQAQAARAMADGILAVVKRDDAIAHPVGYEIALRREIGVDRDTPIGAPFAAGAAWDVWGYSVFVDAHGGESIDTDGRFGMSILANSVSCDALAVDDIPDHGLPVVPGMRKTGEYRGHPIWNGQCVIISRSAEPAYIPVTRERFMKLHLLALRDEQAKGRKNLAGVDAALRAKIEPDLAAFDRAVAAEQARLDAMSASERAQPATIDWGAGGNWKTAQLVPSDRDGAVALMSPNPAIYDGKLPPAQVQVVSVFLPFVQRGVKPPRLEEDSLRRAHAEAIRDGLDWPALDAMVRP
jgi:hypothetical protein